MKAAVREKYGSADVVELRNVDVPVPAAGELPIHVEAAPSTGPTSTASALGRASSAFGMGAFAEYVCAPEKAFEPMPTGMTFEGKHS